MTSPVRGGEFVMARRLAALFSAAAIPFMVVVNLLATCGGGGGGGTGGMGGGGAMGASDVVYQVPWKLIQPADTATPAGGLVVYWFPASQNELQKSSLRNSRTLSLYASQCITMGVADAGTALGQKFAADEKLPVAVLADSDGKILGKAQSDEKGFLRVGQVEKLVDGEMKQRETAVKTAMTTAKDAAKKGDKDAAIARYKTVLDKKCLFPKQAKDAANELKKLGVEGVGPVPDGPDFDRALGARIEKTLQQGLMAENRADYPR